MNHPDLKPLLWGRHLQRLLAVCGRQPFPAEPAPRITGCIPRWFQRVGAVLTLLGLVGGLRTLDRAISTSLNPDDDTVRYLETGAFDAGVTDGWAERLHLRLDPFMLAREHARPPAAWPAGAATGAAIRHAGIDTEVSCAGVADAEISDAAAGDAFPASEFPASEGANPNGTTLVSAELSSPRTHRFLRVQATAYTSRIEETDDTPFITASNLPPGIGTIALSRDLLRTFTRGAPFDFRDKVLIPGVGIFEVRDTMHPRWTEKADIWFASLEKARAWGHRTVFLTRIDESAETIALQLH